MTALSRSRRRPAAPALVLVLLAFASLPGCSCGGQVRLRSDGGDLDAAASDAGRPDVADSGSTPLDATGPDLGPPDLGTPDLGAFDLAAPDAIGLDADSADAAAADALDADDDAADAPAADAGERDAGADSGCGPGLSPCPDPDGIVRCVDLLWDHCNCHRCGQACLCFEGACSDCGGPLPYVAICGPAVCRPGDHFACVDYLVDPTHCGGCYIACAPGEECSDGVCMSLDSGM